MSNAVTPGASPPPPAAAPEPTAVPAAVPWYRQWGRRIAAALCTVSFVYGCLKALSDPPLPQHLLAGEVALESKDTVTFHTDVGSSLTGVCINDALEALPLPHSGLTLDYGACVKRRLRIIPAAASTSRCHADGTSLVLKLTDLPTGCGALLRWSNAAPHDVARSAKLDTPPAPIPVPSEVQLLIKGEPSILGNLKIASLEAAGGRSVEAALGALLGDASGNIELAASSMQLVHLSLVPKSSHGLPVPGPALRADFAEAAMGRVTKAELDQKDRILRWRWAVFFAGLVPALVSLLVSWAQSKLGSAVR